MSGGGGGDWRGGELCKLTLEGSLGATGDLGSALSNFRLCGEGLLVLEPRLPTRGGASTRCVHCSWEGRGAERAGTVTLTTLSYLL